MDEYYSVAPSSHSKVDGSSPAPKAKARPPKTPLFALLRGKRPPLPPKKMTKKGCIKSTTNDCSSDDKGKDLPSFTRPSISLQKLPETNVPGKEAVGKEGLDLSIEIEDR